MLLRATIVLAAASVVGLSIIAVGDGGQENAPPRPAWVNADGTIDAARAPERVYVEGPDGELVRCANGKLLQVPALQMPPPPAPRGVPPASATEALVPRCGTGRDAHLNPVSVPQSRDPLR